jgi:hypothetical protein
MTGNEVKGINAAHEFHKRALAYATNHPGVSVTEAKNILATKGAKNLRARKSLNKAKEG